MRSSFLISISLVCAFALGLSGCGTNPVTGKKEIQFVSEAQEVQMGEQNYAPTRQSEGGDFTVLPELTSYVSEVGKSSRVSLIESSRMSSWCSTTRCRTRGRCPEARSR